MQDKCRYRFDVRLVNLNSYQIAVWYLQAMHDRCKIAHIDTW